MKLKDILRKRQRSLTLHIQTELFDGDNVNLYKELYYDDNEISDHMECQAGMMAWWSMLHRTLEAEYEELNLRYDMWHTLLYEAEYDRLWTVLGRLKSKKPNISSVENAVRRRRPTEYLRWHRELRKAKLNVSICKDAVKSWEEKGRMLVQSAKIRSAEMNSIDFHVKDVKNLQDRMNKKKGYKDG